MKNYTMEFNDDGLNIVTTDGIRIVLTELLNAAIQKAWPEWSAKDRLIYYHRLKEAENSIRVLSYLFEPPKYEYEYKTVFAPEITIHKEVIVAGSKKYLTSVTKISE